MFGIITTNFIEYVEKVVFLKIMDIISYLTLYSLLNHSLLKTVMHPYVIEFVFNRHNWHVKLLLKILNLFLLTFDKMKV